MAAAGGESARLSVNFRSVPAVLAEVERAVAPVMTTNPASSPFRAADSRPGARRESRIPAPRAPSGRALAVVGSAAPARAAATKADQANAVEAAAIAADIRDLHDPEGLRLGELRPPAADARRARGLPRGAAPRRRPVRGAEGPLLLSPPRDHRSRLRGARHPRSGRPAGDGRLSAQSPGRRPRCRLDPALASGLRGGDGRPRRTGGHPRRRPGGRNCRRRAPGGDSRTRGARRLAGRAFRGGALRLPAARRIQPPAGRRLGRTAACLAPPRAARRGSISRPLRRRQRASACSPVSNASSTRRATPTVHSPVCGRRSRRRRRPRMRGRPTPAATPSP